MSATGQKKPYSQKKDQLKNEELIILRRIFSIFIGPGCDCRYTAIQLAKIFFSPSAAAITPILMSLRQAWGTRSFQCNGYCMKCHIMFLYNIVNFVNIVTRH